MTSINNYNYNNHRYYISNQRNGKRLCIILKEGKGKIYNCCLLPDEGRTLKIAACFLTKDKRFSPSFVLAND